MQRHPVVPACLLGLGALLAAMLPASGAEIDLTVGYVPITTEAFQRTGIGFNGASPGPVLRFTEGEEVTINVTNTLSEDTSIHWHGLILPPNQDGVPGISFPGIAPGETFTYRFPIVQAGTYWYHSHSGLQEPDGAYGAIVIEPAGSEPFRFDRDYVVLLTDAHPHSGERVMRNLKLMSDYYNRQQRTLVDFLGEMTELGFDAALADRLEWGEMRMAPTDIEDVHGYVPLINGMDPVQNWTGLFTPGERIRLRFINASAMAYFDIRIPGLQMTVVQADGNNVRPVVVDELRISVAETYDVVVRPEEDRPYTLFAESVGRTAFARGTLAPREGLAGEVPDLREPPLLTMADMGMAHEGMDHGDMEMGGGDHVMSDGTVMQGPMDGMDHAAMGHDMPSEPSADPFYAAGSGLAPVAAGGGRMLSYRDLVAQAPLYDQRPPTREITIRLTGNMERYIWSFDGIKYSDAEPIRLQYGERVRFTFVNETMMAHPMHLHGMWSILDTGNGASNPAKHVVSVAPGSTLSMETEVDAPGRWAFHCHLSYHMNAGMFREVIVEGGPDGSPTSVSHVPGG